MNRITVLGIGNILLQDEGYGVRVIEGLARDYSLPPEVQVLDGGTLGMDLLRFIDGTTHLIVVDAVDGGQEPGTFYHFSGQAVETYFQEKVSLHELGIKEVLASLEVLGKKVGEVLIIGVQPASLDLGLELTAAVAGKVGEGVASVLTQLAAWGVEVKQIAGCSR